MKTPRKPPKVLSSPAILGKIPVAGFFCGGELGPVGGQNFLHTFTASIALFPETAP